MDTDSIFGPSVSKFLLFCLVILTSLFFMIGRACTTRSDGLTRCIQQFTIPFPLFYLISLLSFLLIIVSIVFILVMVYKKFRKAKTEAVPTSSQKPISSEPEAPGGNFSISLR